MRCLGVCMVAVLFWFGGCVPHAALASDPLVADEKTNQESFSLRGEIGRDRAGWVFLYRAHDEPTEDYEYSATLRLRTTSSEQAHSAALFGPVSVALLGDGTLAPRLDFFPDQIRHSTSGDAIELTLAGSGSGSGMQNPTAGFVIVAAADTAFTLEYELGFAEGVGLNEAASFDAVGHSAAFYYAGGLPGHLATFKQLSAELAEPGWSHFAILTGLGATGPAVRATHATFPSERRESHVEYYVPSFGTTPVAYAGVIRDSPGLFRGQSLVVEPHVDIELVLLHMPGVADQLGYLWRTGSYHEGSPPV